MTQHVKAPTTNPVDLGSVPRTSIVEIREPTPSSVLCPVHTLWHVCANVHTNRHSHTKKIVK